MKYVAPSGMSIRFVWQFLLAMRSTQFLLLFSINFKSNEKNWNINQPQTKILRIMFNTVNQNYSTHSYGFFVSTTTSLVVTSLLLVIRTRLKVERTWIVKKSKITKVWKQYNHILKLYHHTTILILLRWHMFLLQKKHPMLLVR
jgi:hypothetical protein